MSKDRLNIQIFATLSCIELLSFVLYLFSIVNYNISLIRIALIIAFSVNILFSISNLKTRFNFLIFNISFFTLLLGRTFLYRLSASYNTNYGLENATPETVFEVMSMLYVSLVFLLIGYIIATFINSRKEMNVTSLAGKYNEQQALACLIVFYGTMIFNIAESLDKMQYVSATSYIDYYVNYSSSLPSIVLKLSEFCPIAFCGYLACFPPKRKATKHIICYLILSSLTMLMGSRGEFILSLLLIALYCSIRNTEEEKWITKKNIIYAILLVPLLMILMVAIKALRYDQKLESYNIFRILSDFFIQQGVSISVLKATVELKDTLKKWAFYSFAPVTDFLKGNTLSQFIHPFVVYRKNTIENALQSNHLANYLSYRVLGNMYLRGRGIGTSYIAELYADFRYFGIVVGNLFIGNMISFLPRYLIRTKSFFINTIILLMLKELIFCPRSSFSAFLVAGINFTSLACILIMLILSWIIGRLQR